MMLKPKTCNNIRDLKKELQALNNDLQQNGINYKNLTYEKKRTKTLFKNIILFCLPVFVIVLYTLVLEPFLYYSLGIRCLLPNNYFVWEATRPITDCQFCVNVTAPIILLNATREDFSKFAYTSRPVIIKRAFLHWPAFKKFDFEFFKNLYESVEDSIRSVDEECQFLHFKSNFISLKDVFEMPISRVYNKPGEKSWYVGWGNCHPLILQEMRKYYSKPHFLPKESEIPSKDYVFMGYDAGATMHLDFINRLMWQAQLKGSKIWNLLPSNECDQICRPIQFLVEPGDGVLVDTRIWYHGTTIPAGEFSLAIQSEYG